MYSQIKDEIQKALQSFPNVFDERLSLGLDRLIVNSPKNFFPLRSYYHIKVLLLTQFFLQRKVENALKDGFQEQKLLFLKLFHYEARFCCALTFFSCYDFNREQLLNIFHTLLPGIQEIPNSFFMWYHPELSYQFCYIELEKLRGKGLSTKDLRVKEKSLRDLLIAIPPLTPALFWPYNEEESFRQIQIMRKEMQNPAELPHISILFQEQTLSSLEFLVHYVKPKASSHLENNFKLIPSSFDLLWRFKRNISLPFPIEIGAFSIKIPSSIFDARGSINLLYARRYITKYLETIFGPFRDYNGGLFEKQQYQFEIIRVNLSEKIPLFDLFAEKVFYALQPIEARLGLSLKDAETLLLAFAELIQTRNTSAIIQKDDNIVAIKNGYDTNSPGRYKELSDLSKAHAYLTLGNAYYFGCLGPNIGSHISMIPKENNFQLKKSKTLRLSFQEGPPPSINPHLSSSDMRCRLLSKLLFEGLMRLNASAEPELAGALEYFRFENGLNYIFKLRSCFWSNGEKVTSIDYVTSWQHALREHVSHPEQLFAIKNGRLFKEFKCDEKKLGIRALDPVTLEIELEQPDPNFLYKLAQPFFFPLFGSLREPKWFNGPYLIHNRTKEGLLLERNPYFWEITPPFFEQIEIKWHSDVHSIYQFFHEGKTDWIGDPISTLSPVLIQNLEKQGSLKTQKVNRRFLVHFNTRLPHLSLPLIRHALSLSIERSMICDTIFPYSIPLHHPSPFQETAEDLFEQGLQILRLKKNNFPPLTFSYSHQTGREKLASYFQETWEKKLGIPIRLERTEWNVFRKKLEKGEFEITATIQETFEDSPLEFLERVEGSSSWNFSQWRHPLFKKWINKAKKTQDIPIVNEEFF